jgi:uncharacterized membrane protein YozB (DUF420 family)
MSNSGKLKILLLALFCLPNLIATMPSNGTEIIYAILPVLLLGSVGIPLIQVINVLINKRQLDSPSWNDNLFKKNKTLSRYQFIAFFFLVIGLCWIIKTAIHYHSLNENGIMALFFGIGILNGTYLTAYILRSKMQKNKLDIF